ncbi:cytochrome P450 monooxygenase 59 [Trebouxia sp. C0010 RCD-2024]
MAVMLETSRGDLVIDLFTEDCPQTTKNFLKLCKIKYYNNVLFHNVQANFIVQTGDPTGTGKGGDSVYGLMYGDQARFFEDEIRQHLKHRSKGMVAMASGSEGTNASQFYITTGQDLDSLDGKHTIFGEVSEGLDVLQQIDEAFVDEGGRPLQNIRIRHTHVLDDPFDDPPPLAELIPEASPPPTFEQGDRLEDDWKPDEDTRAPEVIEDEIRKSEAKNRAVVLEMIGDLPEADSKPPSNMLFIAKLNPVTTEEDLETIFGRFGNITSCDIIRDKKTGDSLCYAFLGYDTDEASETAYFKMNNVLIDDRRIKVDFSQSVYHLWKQFRKFGRDGGAPDPAQAPPPGGVAPGALGGHDRLQLKTAGATQRGKPKQQYDLLLDGDVPTRQPRNNGTHQSSMEQKRSSHKEHKRLSSKEQPPRRHSSQKDSRDDDFKRARDHPHGERDHQDEIEGHQQSRHKRSRGDALEGEERARSRKHGGEGDEAKDNRFDDRPQRGDRHDREHKGDEYRSSRGRGHKLDDERKGDHSSGIGGDKDVRRESRNEVRRRSHHEHSHRRQDDCRHSPSKHAESDRARRVHKHGNQDSDAHHRH